MEHVLNLYDSTSSKWLLKIFIWTFRASVTTFTNVNEIKTNSMAINPTL